MTTMPLSELPSNHSARNGIGQPRSQDDLQNDGPRKGTPNGDGNLELLKKPSSIQSMLRNTTETGNVGQFSIKPSRIPPPFPPSLKARATPSKQRRPRANFNRNEDGNINHTQFHSRQGTTASNGSGSQSQTIIPHHRPVRSPSVEDYRSYSTTKSSYTSHGPLPNHSHTNGIHGGHEGPHNMRPRSPFAYPTRLKRPGFRPSSPALSELNKQDRSQASLYRRPSFRTNSPSSLHTNGTPSPWRKGVNRSEPLLRYYPQFTVPVSGRAPSPSSNSTRPPLRKGSPSFNSIANSHTGLQATPNSSWTNLQSQTHSPIFYDYTEAFGEQGVEQQDYSHYVTMSTGTLAEHQMLDTATTASYELETTPDDTSGTGQTSENSFSKLKTPASDNKFDQTTSQFEMNDQSSMQALHKDLSEVPEVPEGETSNAEIDVAPAKHSDGPHNPASQYPFPKQPPDFVSSAEHLKQPLDHGEQRNSHSKVESASSASPNPEKSNGDSSSPTRSIDSTHPALQPPSVQDSPSPKDSKSKSGVIATPSPVELPATAGFDHGQGNVGEHRQSTHLLRAGSLDDHSGNEHTVTEIISPTPERLMTSPTAVSRFSKILSIKDDTLDLDELANRIKGKDKADSPVQSTVDSRTRLTHIEPTWRKRSVQLRDVAARQNAVNFTLAEESDSEDEPELTQGLRQTFCKTDDGPLDSRSRSPPITLPSQLVHRGYPGPLSIRRSPAVRRSTSAIRKVHDPSNVHPVQGLGITEASPIHIATTEESRPSSPVQTNTVLIIESPRKLSFQDRSTPVTKPSPPLAPPPNKELPPLPSEQPAIVSLSPPVAPRVPSLPFAFTHLIQRDSEDETASVAELKAVASSYLDQAEKTDKDKRPETPIPPTAISPAKISRSSLPESRPWNLDTSYPWSNQQPKLEVTMPEPTEDPNRSTTSLPRFRFRLQRASSTTGGTSTIVNYPQSTDASSIPFVSNPNVFQGAALRQTRYPALSVMPGQINSSHDLIRSSPSQTRFVESFETQSPRITLIPPSPGFEARSFFSDDSSQVSPKRMFRKRISALRKRRSRGASAEEPRSYDRGLLSSALGRSRASGRSSRQSDNTAVTGEASTHTSQTKRARRRFVNKLRSWWQRGEDRVREWRWRRRYNAALGRSVSADLYTGF